MPRSLSVRVSAAFILALWGSAVLNLVYELWEGRENIAETILASETNRADTAAERFQSEINHLREDLQALVGTPPISGIIRAMADPNNRDAEGASSLTDWKTRLQSIFISFMRGHDHYAQLRYIGLADTGREIVRVDQIDGRPAVIPEERLQQKGDRDYFRAGLSLRPGEIYISDITLNRENGQVEIPHWPTLRGVLPVFGPDGKMFGMVVINKNVQNTLRLVSAAPDAGVSHYLINGSGDFLIHPNVEKTFGFDLGRRFQWRDEFPDLPLSDIAGGSRLNRKTTEEYPVQLDEFYWISRKIEIDPDNPKRNLQLIYAIPESLIGEVIGSGVNSMILTVTALAFAIGGVVLVYLRRILRPLAELAGAAQAIGEGRLDAPLPKARFSELAALTRAFKNMIAQLNARNRAPVMMHSADAEGRLTYVNDYWVECLGYDRQEVLGRAWTDFVVKDKAVATRSGGYGNCKNLPLKIKKKHGHPLDVLMTAIPERWGDGAAKFSLAVLIDVTGEERMLEALQASDRRFKKAFQSAGHGIAMFRLDDTWVDANDSLCSLLGYDRKDLLGRPPSTLVIKRDYKVLQANIERLLADHEETFQMEVRLVGWDDNPVPAILSAGLVVRNDGSPDYLVFQFSDLTALKKAEAQFTQAQKMESIGNLTGGVAHDFNNLLGIILGNLQLLQRRLGEDQQLQKFAEDAVEATKRGADLTRQLLAFSRRQQLEPEILDANAMVKKMVPMLERTLGTNIEIGMNLEAAPPFVKADPAQLESALLNLSINARDAMPSGGRLIIATSCATLDPLRLQFNEGMHEGQFVRITVTDTGHGISQELQDRIFEPFFTTKEAGKGSGLGLSMVYGFVQQSGGQIQVYSEEGQGTSFSMYLPAVDEAGDIQVATVKDGETALPTGTGTILLVEDERRFREVAALQLEDLGYTVISAANGQEALDNLAVVSSIDLLFTDMVMPGGMNGLELADKVREMFPDIPVLLTSGFPRDAFNEGRRYALLQKPYTDKQLSTAVKEALETEGKTITGETL